MSELCNSSTTTPNESKFHTLLLHDIFLFFSFILSHPLYFSYFIFFSPYLLKLLSFLSPLFLTTLLLLLSLLTFSIRDDSTLDSPQHNPGFLLTTFLKITKKLRPKNIQLEKDHEDHMYNFEDFEVYKIVFDQTPTFTFDHHVIRENATPIDQVPDSDSDCVTKVCTHEVSGVTVTGTGEPKLASFLALLDKFENMGKVSKKVVDEPEPPPCPKSNKAVGELQKEDPVVIGSEAMPIKIINDDCSTVNVGTAAADNGCEYTLKEVASNAQPEKFSGNVNDADNGREYSLKSLDGSSSFDSNSSLASYGSMRKEKDWKRTLACKLFEERHNGGGEDGMDSLWETYETDLSKKDHSKKVIGKSKNGTNANANAKKNSRKSSPKKSAINSEYYYDFENEEEEDDHDQDQDLANGICCLQALKMSSGKMNFGMGKPNLVKITKALRGIGWLHHTSRHGKKR